MCDFLDDVWTPFPCVVDTVNDMVNALNNVVSDAAEWADFCDENDATKMALIGVNFGSS